MSSSNQTTASSSEKTTTTKPKLLSPTRSAELGKLFVCGLMLRSKDLIELVINERQAGAQVGGGTPALVLSCLDSVFQYLTLCSPSRRSIRIIRKIAELRAKYINKKTPKEEIEEEFVLPLVHKFVKSAMTISVSFSHLGYSVAGPTMLASDDGIGSFSFREKVSQLLPLAKEWFSADEDLSGDGERPEPFEFFAALHDVWLYMSKTPRDKFIGGLTFRSAKGVIAEALLNCRLYTSEQLHEEELTEEEREQVTEGFHTVFDALYVQATKRKSSSWPCFLLLAQYSLGYYLPCEEKEKGAMFFETPEELLENVRAGLKEKGSIFGKRHPLPAKWLVHSSWEDDNSLATPEIAILEYMSLSEKDYLSEGGETSSSPGEDLLRTFCEAHLTCEGKPLPSHRTVRMAAIENKH